MNEAPVLLAQPSPIVPKGVTRDDNSSASPLLSSVRPSIFHFTFVLTRPSLVQLKSYFSHGEPNSSTAEPVANVSPLGGDLFLSVKAAPHSEHLDKTGVPQQPACPRTTATAELPLWSRNWVGRGQSANDHSNVPRREVHSKTHQISTI